MQDFMRIAFLVGKRMDMRIKRVPPKKKHEILFYNFPRHVIHDKHNLLRQKMVLDSSHNKFDTIQDNNKKNYGFGISSLISSTLCSLSH